MFGGNFFVAMAKGQEESSLKEGLFWLTVRGKTVHCPSW